MITLFILFCICIIGMAFEMIIGMAAIALLIGGFIGLIVYKTIAIKKREAQSKEV